MKANGTCWWLPLLSAAKRQQLFEQTFAEASDDTHANRELLLARPFVWQPTAWLYSALLKQQQNRIKQPGR